MEKAMREVLRSEFGKVWHNDEKMVKFCVGKADSFVETADGIFVIEKPTIETRFCFGYHDSPYDTESYDSANNAAVAAHSESYFVRENMEKNELKAVIERMKEFLTKGTVIPWVRRKAYCSQTDDCRLASFEFTRWYEERQGLEKMTKEDARKSSRLMRMPWDASKSV